MNFSVDLRGQGPGYTLKYDSPTELREHFGARNLPVRGIQNDPPATMVAFDDFVVGASPTGAWGGHADEIARVEQDAAGALSWGFYPPDEGDTVRTPDRITHGFDGGAWAPVPGGTVTANDPTALHVDVNGEILGLGAKAPTVNDAIMGEDENGVKFRAAFPLGGGGGGAVGFKTHIKGGANQSVSGFVADVEWTGSVVRNDGGWFDPNISTSKITPGAGRFNVAAQLRIGAPGSGIPNGIYCDFSLQRFNASDQSVEWIPYQRFAAAGGGALAGLSAFDVDFAAGDYLKARCGAGVSSWTIDHAMSWIRVTAL